MIRERWFLLLLVLLVMSFQGVGQTSDMAFELEHIRSNGKGLRFAIVSTRDSVLRYPSGFQVYEKGAYSLEFGELTKDTFLVEFTAVEQVFPDYLRANIYLDGEKRYNTLPTGERLIVLWPRKLIDPQLRVLTVKIDDCEPQYLAIPKRARMKK